MVRRLLDAGVKGVAIADFDKEQGMAATAEFQKQYGEDRVLFLHCDVTKPEQLAKVFSDTAAWARSRSLALTLVCNNAGFGGPSILDPDCQKWRSVIDVCFTAVIHGTQLALRYFDTKRGGVIVNTASMGGLIAMDNDPVYSGAKHGVVGFSRSLAFLHKQRNVRVNALCPSFTDTPMVRRALTASKEFKQSVQALGKQVTGTHSAMCSVETVGEAFMRIVRDESLSGRVVRITLQNGIDLQPYPGEKPTASFPAAAPRKSKL